jgi:hypothetical protein
MRVCYSSLEDVENDIGCCSKINASVVAVQETFRSLQCLFVCLFGPPLWSSGQSSWLQIRRPGFDSRHYQKIKVVGLEWGPLSLVSTTEELLDRKIAAPV